MDPIQVSSALTQIADYIDSRGSLEDPEIRGGISLVASSVGHHEAGVQEIAEFFQKTKIPLLFQKGKDWTKTIVKSPKAFAKALEDSEVKATVKTNLRLIESGVKKIEKYKKEFEVCKRDPMFEKIFKDEEDAAILSYLFPISAGEMDDVIEKAAEDAEVEVPKFEELPFAVRRFLELDRSIYWKGQLTMLDTALAKIPMSDRELYVDILINLMDVLKRRLERYQQDAKLYLKGGLEKASDEEKKKIEREKLKEEEAASDVRGTNKRPKLKPVPKTVEVGIVKTPVGGAAARVQAISLIDDAVLRKILSVKEEAGARTEDSGPMTIEAVTDMLKNPSNAYAKRNLKIWSEVKGSIKPEVLSAFTEKDFESKVGKYPRAFAKIPELKEAVLEYEQKYREPILKLAEEDALEFAAMGPTIEELGALDPDDYQEVLDKTFRLWVRRTDLLNEARQKDGVIPESYDKWVKPVKNQITGYANLLLFNAIKDNWRKFADSYWFRPARACLLRNGDPIASGNRENILRWLGSKEWAQADQMFAFEYKKKFGESTKISDILALLYDPNTTDIMKALADLEATKSVSPENFIAFNITKAAEGMGRDVQGFVSDNLGGLKTAVGADPSLDNIKNAIYSVAGDLAKLWTYDPSMHRGRFFALLNMIERKGIFITEADRVNTVTKYAMANPKDALKKLELDPDLVNLLSQNMNYDNLKSKFNDMSSKLPKQLTFEALESLLTDLFKKNDLKYNNILNAVLSSNASELLKIFRTEFSQNFSADQLNKAFKDFETHLQGLPDNDGLLQLFTAIKPWLDNLRKTVPEDNIEATNHMANQLENMTKFKSPTDLVLALPAKDKDFVINLYESEVLIPLITEGKNNSVLPSVELDYVQGRLGQEIEKAVNGRDESAIGAIREIMGALQRGFDPDSFRRYFDREFGYDYTSSMGVDSPEKALKEIVSMESSWQVRPAPWFGESLKAALREITKSTGITEERKLSILKSLVKPSPEQILERLPEEIRGIFVSRLFGDIDKNYGAYGRRQIDQIINPRGGPSALLQNPNNARVFMHLAGLVDRKETIQSVLQFLSKAYGVDVPAPEQEPVPADVDSENLSEKAPSDEKSRAPKQAKPDRRDKRRRR